MIIDERRFLDTKRLAEDMKDAKPPIRTISVRRGGAEFPDPDELARVFGRTPTFDLAVTDPIKTQKVRDAVVERLAEKVMAGVYPQGLPLPNEDQLCEQLGVSRTSIREAVRSLAAKGMLETRPRTGTIVLPRENWSRLDPEVLRWTYAFGEDVKFVRSLIEARSVIEPAAAEFAAERATKEDLKNLKESFEIMTENFQVDLDRCSLADLQFHRSILVASHNDVLIQLGSAMSAALLASFRQITSLAESHAAAIDAHRAVLDAIRDRDPQAAREAMLAVLSVARSRFKP